MLVDQNPADGHRLAKETYDRAPDDVNVAMTYAYSLYMLGRTAEGIAIMKKLPLEGVHDPHAAVYAALLLLDENNAPAAQEYIFAAQAGPIFPEEKKLLDEALVKVKSTPASSPIPTAPPP